MKNKYILPILVLGSTAFGQFTVSGQFENYPDKSVLVKIYDNAELKLLKNTKTDKQGNFSANVPKEYTGIVRVDLPTGENISLLTDNKNIKFKTTTGQDFAKNLTVIEGDAQKDLVKAEELQPLNDVQAQVFPYLMQMYKPTDEFYVAMVKEDKRINTIKNNAKFTPLVTYINALKELKQSAQNNTAPQLEEKIITHFVNDDEKLEQSGLFSDLVFAYINSSIAKAGGKDIENNLILATDNILNKTDIQTTRGQNVLTTILNFVPADQYPNFHKIYVDKVNGLTCKITEQLKKKVGQSSAIKVGAKVPNITFDQAIKGKKSLYDIKANQKLIVFWASWCPACQQEIPYIKEYYKEFKAKGGEIVAISLDYDKNEFDKAIKDFSWYNYTDLLRWDSPIVEQFGVESTPTLFLVDKDNKLIKVAHHISEFEAAK